MEHHAGVARDTSAEVLLLVARCLSRCATVEAGVEERGARHVDVHVVARLRRVCTSWNASLLSLPLLTSWDAVSGGWRSVKTATTSPSACPLRALTAHLRRLRLSNARGLGPELAAFCASTPCLEGVYLFSCSFLSPTGLCFPAHSLPSVTTLHLTRLPQLTGPALSALAAAAPRVTDLLLDTCGVVHDVSGTDAFGSVHLSPPLVLAARWGGGNTSPLALPLTDEDVALRCRPWLSNLTRLALINCMTISDAGLCAVLSACTSLRELDLSRCRLAGAAGGGGVWRAIFSGVDEATPPLCSRLTHLTLSGVGSAVEAVRACEANAIAAWGGVRGGKLRPTLPLLQHLDLSWCMWLTDEACAALSHVLSSSYRLKSLSLHACTRMSGVGLCALRDRGLVSSAPVLTSLDLGQTVDVSDADVAGTLALPLPSLTSFNFSGCPHVGLATYRAMGVHCPLLEQVGSRLTLTANKEAVWAWVSAAQEGLTALKRTAWERRAREGPPPASPFGRGGGERGARQGAAAPPAHLSSGDTAGWEEEASQWVSSRRTPGTPQGGVQRQRLRHDEGCHAGHTGERAAQSMVETGEGEGVEGEEDDDDDDAYGEGDGDSDAQEGSAVVRHSTGGAHDTDGRRSATPTLAATGDDGYASITHTDAATTTPMRWRPRAAPPPSALPRFFGAPQPPPPSRWLDAHVAAAAAEGEATPEAEVHGRERQQRGAPRVGGGGGATSGAWDAGTTGLPLRKLDWWRSLEIGDDACRALAAFCPNLREVVLDGCEVSLTDAGVVALVASCPSLTSLSLVGCALTDVSLKAIARAPCAGRLVFIDLSGGLEYTRRGLETLFRSAVRLQSVKLQPCTGVCNGSLRTLLSSCKDLRTLTIRGCSTGVADTPLPPPASDEGGDLLTSSILREIGLATLPPNHPLCASGSAADPDCYSLDAHGGRLCHLGIGGVPSFTIEDILSFTKIFVLDRACSLKVFKCTDGLSTEEVLSMEAGVRALVREAYGASTPPCHEHVLATATALYMRLSAGQHAASRPLSKRHRALLRMEYLVPGVHMEWRGSARHVA